MPSLVESGSVVFEKNLKSPYYHYLSLERELSFIWINFCRIFVFPYRNYLPVSKSNALHFNKLKFSLLKDAVCQVWLKLVNWFLRRSQRMKKKILTDRLDRECQQTIIDHKNSWHAFSSRELKINLIFVTLSRLHSIVYISACHVEIHNAAAHVVMNRLKIIFSLNFRMLYIKLCHFHIYMYS